MPTGNVNEALVAETKALIAEVERGETAHAAWVAIQDRMRRLAEDRTQREVAYDLGKSIGWVNNVLTWDRDHDHGLPQGGPKQDVAQSKSRARKALRDPEIRAQVIESLTETERLEVAQAAMAPMEREGRRTEKEHRAHRESQPAHDRAHLDLIVGEFTRIRLATLEALKYARDTTWTEDGAAMVEEMVDGAVTHLGVLREAVEPSADVDWDEALAKLGEAS